MSNPYRMPQDNYADWLEDFAAVSDAVCGDAWRVTRDAVDEYESERTAY